MCRYSPAHDLYTVSELAKIERIKPSLYLTFNPLQKQDFEVCQKIALAFYVKLH